MGYNTYTTQTLVSKVVLKSHLPLSNDTFTASDVISLADDEIKTPLLKLILSTRGGYYKMFLDFPSNQAGLYLIPPNATCLTLENIELIQNTSIIQVNPIDEAEQFSTISPTSTTYGYFMVGNYVQILPTPPVGNVRLWFSRRPSQLVLTSACGQITNIDFSVPLFTTITVASLPSTMIVGSLLEIVGDQPPFNIFGQGVVTAISGTNVTLAGVILDFVVGDWLCLQNQTCVPQIPVEFRPVLEMRVVAEMFRLQGGSETKYKAAKEKAKELEDDVLSLLTTRVKSQTKIVSTVQGGFLSGNRGKISNFAASKDQ